jgi:hypothetical protein
MRPELACPKDNSYRKPLCSAIAWWSQVERKREGSSQAIPAPALPVRIALGSNARTDGPLSCGIEATRIY